MTLQKQQINYTRAIEPTAECHLATQASIQQRINEDFTTEESFFRNAAAITFIFSEFSHERHCSDCFLKNRSIARQVIRNLLESQGHYFLHIHEAVFLNYSQTFGNLSNFNEV